MIAACYSMDLYCENEQLSLHPWNYFPHQYQGETFGECAKHARKDGWIINRNKRTAICPLCNKKYRATIKNKGYI